MNASAGHALRSAAALLTVLWLASACTTVKPLPPPPPAVARPMLPEGLSPPRAGAQGSVFGMHAASLVYVPAEGDTLAAIAERFFSDANRATAIAQANADIDAPRAGQPLLLPRQPPSPLGVSLDGVQTVPVLCYHRFVPGDGASSNKMQMPAARFEAQLAWLARERYRVLRLSELQAFLEGRQALPPRSVVITVDDGWESFYRHAYPLLQKYRMPATLFVYTDIIGTRDGLSWAQLREMAASGWVDIQAHSKTHRSLAERAAGESEAAWRRSVANELRHPRSVLEGRLAELGVKVQHFAYPYGDVNEGVLELMAAEPYTLAFTVRTGGNAFYASRRLLRRTMIFGDHTLEDFISRMQTQRPLGKP
jgi:peptidoglycan/xylan/chitin deacetylase (PgdA/CDA1 family)